MGSTPTSKEGAELKVGVWTFLRDVWSLAKPYFTRSKEKRFAWLLLGVNIALSLSLVYISVVLNYWNSDFYDALQALDMKSFVSLLFWYKPVPAHGIFGIMPGFCETATVYCVIAVYGTYLNQWLQIRWRAWMTKHLVDEWLADRAYYRIIVSHQGGEAGTDNPDQRISEDLNYFVVYTLSLGLDLLSNVCTFISFITILWGLSGIVSLAIPAFTLPIPSFLHFGSGAAGLAFSSITVHIPGYLVFVALAYSALGTWLTHKVGSPLTKLRFFQQKVEADYRYALVRIRENAEAIALHHGEEDEKAHLQMRFTAVIANWTLIMIRTKQLMALTTGYAQVANIFPLAVAAPRFFAKVISLGVLMQITNAFGSVQGALSWIINNYAGSTGNANITQLRAIVSRLSTFQRAIAIARAAKDKGIIMRDTTGGGVHAGNLTLQLPGGVKLLEDASVDLTPGVNVVVVGASGSGKSTLFRALAGIWPFGKGTVSRPAERCQFLPQRPYIPLGTLRRVVTFPALPGTYTDAQVVEALNDVGLGHLASDIDKDDGWPRRLSGGEQQRVAVARALLMRPDWLFLDEATASLDPKGEADLYTAIKRRLPKTTIVSIAHRKEVSAFHDERLELQRDGDGKPGTLVRGPANGG